MTVQQLPHKRLGARKMAAQASLFHDAKVRERSLMDPSVRPIHILLVEDHPINLRMLSLILSKLGYRYDTAMKGREACLQTKQNNYDLILMDVEMPEMDGLSATRQIRTDNTTDMQPWIIAVTAHVLPKEYRLCQEAGMDGFIPKPVTLDQIRRLMDSITNASQSFSV